MWLSHDSVPRDKRTPEQQYFWSGSLLKYIKNDLYPKVKFIYNPEVDLAVTGKIYNHFKTTCKDRIGGRCITEPNRETYMETIWTMGANKHMQKTALSQKRCAVYTVMQNKFSGICRKSELVWSTDLSL